MMFRRFWLLATALPVLVLADPGAGDTFTGDGTVSVVGQAAADACNAGIGDNYVAVFSGQWNSTLNCGKCVEVVCIDNRCSDTAAPVTAYIVGQCIDCQDKGLDLSLGVFTKVTGSDDSSPYTIDWSFVNCPANGGKSFDALKSSSGTNYQAGTVEGANEASSGVSIREENDKGVNTQRQSELDADGASGTSPTLIALIGLLAAVCIAALAAVAYTTVVKKRKGNKRRGTFTTLTFDKFSSPAQTKATIVKM